MENKCPVNHENECSECEWVDMENQQCYIRTIGAFVKVTAWERENAKKETVLENKITGDSGLDLLKELRKEIKSLLDYYLARR